MTSTLLKPTSAKSRPSLRTAQELREEFDARVVAAKYGDLRAYAWAVHNMILDDYQLAWAEGLESEGRMAIVCPPDTYKSTTVRLWVERSIGRNPDIRILWLMNAGEQAQKQVMTVQMVIKGNKVYKAAFGIEEDTDAQWTKSVLFVQRSFIGPDPTLMATGLNGPYQGLHFNVIVLDDVTNQEDVRSPTTMSYQREKLRGVIIDRLVEDGHIFAILTRWGGSDLYDTYVEMGFTMVVMPIIGDYPWGKSLSPKRFTEEVIERKRQDKGDYLFSLTFMCDTEGTQGNIITRDQIQYWDRDHLPTGSLYCFIGVDPAGSDQTIHDPSCIATVGIDIKTRIKYLVDIRTQRMQVPELRKEILKRVKGTANLVGIGLETVGFQMTMVQDLKREATRLGIYFPLREIPYRSRRTVMHKVLGVDRQKTGRALYLSGQFSAGKLLLPRNSPLVDGVSLESELCSFPNGKHDDRLDAITFACVLAEAAMPRVRFARMRAA